MKINAQSVRGELEKQKLLNGQVSIVVDISSAKIIISWPVIVHQLTKTVLKLQKKKSVLHICPTKFTYVLLTYFAFHDFVES